LDLFWAVASGLRKQTVRKAGEKTSEMSERVPPDRQQVTTLLRAWSGGNKQALDELMPLLYDQLHRLACSCLRAERPDHTLRATALVHEAYLQLVDSEVAWESRIHFYAVAARVLRHILVDYAKASRRQKRGAGAHKLPLDEAALVGPEISHDIVELDDALKLLAEQDPRKSEIVQLIFFGGLTYEETAKALDISVVTVHRDLKMAKAFLYSQLASNP
jgi:RNA polymerase sigma factor (TIGR02999 family)